LRLDLGDPWIAFWESLEFQQKAEVVPARVAALLEPIGVNRAAQGVIGFVEDGQEQRIVAEHGCTRRQRAVPPPSTPSDHRNVPSPLKPIAGALLRHPGL
jgi:hypothetical protein